MRECKNRGHLKEKKKNNNWKDEWKSNWKKIFELPLWLLVVGMLFSTIGLLYVFLGGHSDSYYSYIIYVISFYTLTVLCYYCYYHIPNCYKKIKGKLYDNEYSKKYLTDVAYKTHINLSFSLGINLLYIATNIVSAVVYHSGWFAIFAIYYGIMAIMRFLLVRYIKGNVLLESRLRELKRARVCAWILMSVNIILSGVVLMMVYYDRGFEYQGYLIYVMAVYAFYATASAVVSLLKYRKYNSPVMSVTKMIKLASSLFSMLFLETAMFSQFGQDTPEQTKKIMIMATGAGICAVIVGTSVFLIYNSTKEIRGNKKRRRIYGTGKNRKK